MKLTTTLLLLIVLAMLLIQQMQRESEPQLTAEMINTVIRENPEQIQQMWEAALREGAALMRQYMEEAR
ncbi:MAG: hypothetical protein IH862_00765 [Chloroflexi bacterium]|nr:hypothetical protein [Chloroflexota bacterium]